MIELLLAKFCHQSILSFSISTNPTLTLILSLSPFTSISHTGTWLYLFFDGCTSWQVIEEVKSSFFRYYETRKTSSIRSNRKRVSYMFQWPRSKKIITDEYIKHQCCLLLKDDFKNSFNLYISSPDLLLWCYFKRKLCQYD